MRNKMPGPIMSIDTPPFIPEISILWHTFDVFLKIFLKQRLALACLMSFILSNKFTVM